MRRRGLLLGALAATLARPATARPFGDYAPVDFGPRGPQSYPVHGIDVARFQNEIDWRRVAASGVAFAFLKATEGGDLKDPQFDRNWQLAARHGIPRGAYHFYYFCTPPEVQAQWFIRHVPRRGRALPPVLDLEWNPFSPTCTLRPPGAEVRRQAEIFLDIVARHYGQRPILYTTPEVYAQTGIGRVQAEFWLRSVAKPPDQVYPGQPWVFWQYTGTGVVPGVEGGVDLNVFRGSEGAWRRWLATHHR
jgi:lysozyme